MTGVFYKLRHNGSTLSYIRTFGNYAVTRVNDVSLGYDSTRDELPEDRPVLPSSEMITFELDNSSTMTLRQSGTEPKLKYYIESKGISMAEAQSKAEDVEKALLSVFRDFGLET
jgi:phosphomannomutase